MSIQESLDSIEAAQNESYQWLKLHQQNVRRIVAGLITLQRRMRGIDHGTSRQEDNESIDPDSVLLPLVIPNIFPMLEAGGTEVEVAVTYLEILLEKKMLQYDVFQPYCEHPQLGESNRTILPANRNDFIDSLRTHMETFLNSLTYRHLWKRIENILDVLA